MEMKKLRKGCHQIEGEAQPYNFMCYDIDKCKRSSAFFCPICASIFHKDHLHEKLNTQNLNQNQLNQSLTSNSTHFSERINMLRKLYHIIDLVVSKLSLTLMNVSIRNLVSIENDIKNIKNEFIWEIIRGAGLEENFQTRVFEILEIFIMESYELQVTVEEASKFRKIIFSIDLNLMDRKMNSLERFYDKESSLKKIEQSLKDHQRERKKQQINEKQCEYFLICLKKILSPITPLGSYLNTKQPKQKEGQKKLEYMQYLVKLNKQLQNKLNLNEKKLEEYKKLNKELQEKIESLLKQHEMMRQKMSDKLEMIRTSTFTEENERKKNKKQPTDSGKRKKKNKYGDIDQVIPEEPSLTSMISQKAFQPQSLSLKGKDVIVLKVNEETIPSSISQLSFKVISNNQDSLKNQYILCDQISFNKKTSAQTDMIPPVPSKVAEKTDLSQPRRYSITNQSNLHPVGGAKRFSLGDLQRKIQNQKIIKEADPKLKNKLIRQAESLKGNFDSYFKQGQNMILKCQIVTTAIDFSSVKILKLSNNNIQDLSLLGLVNFKNIKYLLLNNNLIDSITPICQVDFKCIQVFSLDFNLIDDLSPLARTNLRNIKVLSLNSNKIQRLYPLVSVNFRNLQGLALSNNLIRDPNPLKQLDYKIMFWIELKNNKFEKQELQWIKKAIFKNKNGSKICLYL